MDTMVIAAVGQSILRVKKYPKTKIRKLTIILPVYNPHKGWEMRLLFLLNKLAGEFKDVEYYVTIVNDGSTNEIGFFIENELIPAYHNLQYLSYKKNRGKGYAIRYGLMHSVSDHYIYTDFDIPFGIHSLRQTYDILIEGKSNLVLGKRGLSYLKTLPAKRLLLSLGFMIVNTIHTGFRIRDSQAGIKGLDNKAKQVFLTNKTDGFVFELEFILKCLKANLKFNTISVALEKDIKLSDFGTQTLRQELVNYINIIIESKKTPTTFL